MRAEKFLDTNILIYGYEREQSSKQDIARSLISDGWLRLGSSAISVQVLQEFQVNFVRKGESAAETSAVLGDLMHWPVVDNSLSLFRVGLSLKDRWQISLWDAMILAAAHASGATQLITEDLNHGQDYGGVRVINPFM